jgi:serine/threonine kinase PknH
MPEMFGPYELNEILGRGGMGGEVWAATDSRNGRRRIALKFLPHNALLDPDLEKRFQRECCFAASIDHPHILPVYEYEVGDRPYIAMRLVNGRDLRKEIAEHGPLVPERAVAVIEQVAAALTAAHRQGLQHRDVKPSNILLEPGARPGTDHAWLFDWGIAKPIDTDERLTRTWQVVGTPPYVAPERWAEGSREATSDHRADVYSLAIVLYECLAERPPFEGPVSDVEYAHRYTDPPPLPSRQPNGVRIPHGLRAVAAKGLAKRPGDRYASALFPLRAIQ